MPTERNRGRAAGIHDDCPIGEVSLWPALTWILTAVKFLLARYIDQK